MREIISFLIYYLIFPALLAAVMLGGLVYWIVTCPGDVFETSYQSMIQDKYENLVNEQNSKIILIGGSNLGFGMNEELLSEETGYPVVNLGLHAGFGGLFNTEIAKANIQKGDIVLLGYEYGWHEKEYFEKFGVDLVMTGIDSQIEMYRYIPIKKWPEIIGYLPAYCKKKVEQIPASGAYSREAFNAAGHMTFYREFALEQYEEEIEYYGTISLENIAISAKSQKYLERFRDYVLEKEASIYFIAPPLYEKAKISDDDTFSNLIELTEKEIGIKYISDPLEYIYSDEYIYDTIYHCSTLGETKRTQTLIKDLINNGIIEP